MPYKTPPQEIVDILDAPPTPLAVVSPTREYMLLVEYEAYPPLEMLARPYLKLAGLRIDPALSGSQRLRQYTGITILRIADGAERRVALPDGARIGVPSWSSDGTKFAFTQDSESGIEVWTGDPATAQASHVPGIHVGDIIGSPFAWMRDNRHLFIRRIPTDRGREPEAPRVPEAPHTEETAGKVSRMATYQDLLQTPSDEALFAYHATTQIARLDPETGEVTPIGEPGIYLSVRTAPDGEHLLVTRLKRPFSYRVPYFYFARTTEVWDRQGTRLATIADLPVSDEVPQQGVPTGPRNAGWREKEPATLLWVEALDDGDPLKKVPHRDRLMALSAPFTDEPREVLRVTHRFAGIDWTDREGEVLLTEYDRDRRWRTTCFLDLDRPDETRRVLFDLSVNDAYNDPGSPVYRLKPDGERTLLQDGDLIYLSGNGASEEGDRPFLDRMDLVTGERHRLFRCDRESYEWFVAFVGDDRGRIVTRRETPTEPPNFFVRDLDTGELRPITRFTDPAPQITSLKKELIQYRRADGVPLSGTLYLPPGYDPARDGRLPLLIWAYPEEYSDPATAGQVRGSDKTFTRLQGTSPLFFVTQGYAVLQDATMPVVGDPETMNDTFVEQIVGAARAAVDTLVDRGIGDRDRALVAGHSYGAFMTANLLAHSDLFAAGIARSGAYNRTLTPFGFQSERRAYWEAPDVYHRLSPFTHAHRIQKPILLIHGQADNNPGTYTVQTERLFQAIQGNGGTARLVLLPFESHAYRARESVLHVLAEMFEWAERWVKRREAVTAP